jgi:hypothetical protein
MSSKSVDYKYFEDVWNAVKREYVLIAELYNSTIDRNIGHSKILDDYYRYEYEHNRGHILFRLNVKLNKVMETEYNDTHYELLENKLYCIVIAQKSRIVMGAYDIYIYQKPIVEVR